MKNYLLFLLIFSLAACKEMNQGPDVQVQEKSALLSKVPSAKWNIDTTYSSVKWKIFTPDGNTHTLTSSLSGGEIGMHGLLPVTGLVKMNITSLEDIDDEDAGTRAEIKRIMKGSEYFYAEQFPTAELIITDADSLERMNENENVNMMLSMQMKGRSQKITFPAYIKQEKGRFTIKATTRLDRRKCGIRSGDADPGPNQKNLNLMELNISLRISIP